MNENQCAGHNLFNCGRRFENPTSKKTPFRRVDGVYTSNPYIGYRQCFTLREEQLTWCSCKSVSAAVTPRHTAQTSSDGTDDLCIHLFWGNEEDVGTRRTPPDRCPGTCLVFDCHLLGLRFPVKHLSNPNAG